MGSQRDRTGPDAFWRRDDLSEAILETLSNAGLARDAMTIDDLAPLDQFHGGGKPATVRLARLAGLSAGMRVLDAGGGLGGPARTLAVEFGCRVTVVDITGHYVAAGRMLTERMGLAGLVTHEVGDAERLRFADGAFDTVWTQNSGMGIEDKETLYAGFARVLRPGGTLALQEPMAGPVQPPVFPLMWAHDASQSFLWPPERLRAAIASAGFHERAWDDVSDAVAAVPRASIAGTTIQALVMGDRLPAIAAASRRNREEGRTIMVQAVFERMEAREVE
jgi:SAM-dependent methyltransferase